jgi:EmrB/QacA subfamily drug resistance transporter
LILCGLMLAIFLGALDQTIVAVSLSTLSSQLGDSRSLSWIISGYLVAMTVSTPLFGKLGDLYGRRRLLLIAIGWFTLASIGCGLAQNMLQLITARVFQGLGAGGLATLSQAIIGDLLPPRQRGRYQGYISGTFALASVAGPLLGGLLTTYLSWRWIFWINLPLGLTAGLICHRALHHQALPEHRPHIDFLGALLLVGGLTCLLLGISGLGQGATQTAGGMQVLLIAFSILLLSSFALQQKRSPDPLLPLYLLSKRHPLLSGLVAFSASFQLIVLSVMVPLRHEMLTGQSPDQAALHILPLVMGVPLGAFISGRLMAHSGRYKPQILFGNWLLPVCIAALALTPLHNAWLSGVWMLLCGAAIGCQFPACMVSIQTAVSAAHMGVATSTLNLLRAMGGALGIALISSLLLLLLRQAGAAPAPTDGGLADHLSVESLENVFRQLLLIDACFALPALIAALNLPDRSLAATH